MNKYLSTFFALFTILILTSCGSAPDTPSKVVEAYYRAMKANDYEKAVSYCLIKNDKDRQMVIDGLTELQKNGFEIKSFKILSEESCGDEKQVNVKVEITTISQKGADPQTETDNMPAIKVNGKWYVGG